MPSNANGRVLETACLVAILFFNLNWADAEEKITRIRNCGKNAHCVSQDVSSLSCLCDEDCNVYGDCCIDKARMTLNPVIKGISRLNWKCVSISKRNSSEGYKGVYAVARCPDNNEIGELCSRNLDGDRGYHYTLDLPVVSYRTGIYYANVFCAYCHEEYSNLKTLKFEIRCTSPSITLDQILTEAVYLRGKREWILKNQNCSLYALEEEGFEGRECLITTSECPENWSDPDVSSNCLAYSNVVSTGIKDKTTNETEYYIYKNPYCAICNGVPNNALGCVKPIQLRIKYPPKPPPASLSIIMNFNWNFNTCDFPNEVYDAVRGRCHRLSCPTCPSNTGRSCQKDNSTPTGSSEKNDSCVDSFDTHILRESLTLKIEGYLTIGCLTVSITCLTLHNFVFYSIPKLQNLPSRILKSLAWSLIIAQTLFLLGVEPVFKVPDTACVVIAVCLHFFLLSGFFWMNIMSIDVWNTFSHLTLRGSTKNTLKNYSIYAWGGPLVLSSLAVASDQTEMLPLNYRPHFAEYPGICWFANRIGLGLFLYLPICLLLSVNLVLFTITICWLQRQSPPDLVKQATGRKECKRLWLYVKLSTIMGLSWTSGMIASLTDIDHFWYPYILFNGLQGAFIFIMFDIKRNVMEALFRHFGLIPEKCDVSRKQGTDGNPQSSGSSASTSIPQGSSKFSCNSHF